MKRILDFIAVLLEQIKRNKLYMIIFEIALYVIILAIVFLLVRII